ncbi:MAG: glycosyltransferase family 87 protein [Bacteroidales bacterium]
MKKRDIFNWFTLFVIGASLLTLMLNMANGRFLPGDFRVYYSAASSFLSGGPVYNELFYSGSGIYKYSPSTLFFFLPYTLFDFKTASVIHFSLLGAAFWYSFTVIRQLINNYFFVTPVKHEFWLITISFIFILIHFARELYLGNINIILLLLCCLAIRDFLHGKEMQGGILLGIAILTKPYLLILLLPLVLRRKWRALAWLSASVATGLALPFCFPGPQKAISLYSDWANTLLLHGEGFPGKTSLDYCFSLLWTSWPSWGIVAIFMFIYGSATLFILYNIKREQQVVTFQGMAPMDLLFEWFLLIALLPNLIRTDWVLMLFSAPLLTMMVFYVAFHKKFIWIPLLLLLLFFYSSNSDDLLGRDLSHKIMQSGLMGLSNFLLVITAAVIFVNLRRKAPPLPSSRSSARTSSGSGRAPGKD